MGRGYPSLQSSYDRLIRFDANHENYLIYKKSLFLLPDTNALWVFQKRT